MLSDAGLGVVKLAVWACRLCAALPGAAGAASRRRGWLGEQKLLSSSHLPTRPPFRPPCRFIFSPEGGESGCFFLCGGWRAPTPTQLLSAGVQGRMAECGLGSVQAAVAALTAALSSACTCAVLQGHGCTQLVHTTAADSASAALHCAAAAFFREFLTDELVRAVASWPLRQHCPLVCLRAAL